MSYVLFSFLLFCTVYCMYCEYIYEIFKKPQHEVHEELNGYWPAPASLAQQLTDIGSVSACIRRQQY